MNGKVRPSPPWRQWLVGAILLVLAGRASAHDFWEEPAWPLRGPAAAEGVVVYNHGNDDVKEEADAPVQPLMAVLHRDGWDVVKLGRRRAADDVRVAEDVLVDEVAALRRRGYRQVILAGPSRGGWLALMAATRVPVFAVIATSPGGFGTRGDGPQRSFAELRARLPAIRASRVVVVDMAGDPRAERVGGRGAAFRAALAQAGVPALVIDRPAGFSGHTAAMTGRFARAWGECIRAFLAAPGGACPGYAGDELPLPADAADHQRWVGVFPNGDARALAITALDHDSAQAVWAWGDGPAGKPERQPGFERMECKRTGDTLTCPRPKGLAVFRRDGETMDYTWVPADRGKRLSLEMRRAG